MFDFLFGRRPKPEESAPSGETPKAPQQDPHPLTEAVLKGLDLSKEQVIRFTPRDCDNPAAFVKSIIPGDVIIASSGTSLVLSHGDGKLALLTRDRCRELDIVEIKDSRLKLKDIEEVISQRGVALPDLRGVLDPATLDIVKTFMGEGAAGSQFRQFAVSARDAFIGIADPETGRFESFQAEPPEAWGECAVIFQLSTIFAAHLPYIMRVEPMEDMSAAAEKRLVVASAIVNRIEGAQRIQLLEGIT